MFRRRASAARAPQDPAAPRERIEELEQEIARLTESEERSRALFELAPDACYVCDLKGTFVDGNASAERVSGYTRAELIGKSFLGLKLLSATDLVRAAALLARNALGQPTGPDEFTLHQKDGALVQVEIETRPVTVGGRRLVLANAQDVTALRLAEERLAERTKELEAFFRLGEIDHREGITLERLCREFVAVLPQSWQHREVACARIQISGIESRTDNFRESPWRQSSPIVVSGALDGEVEVAYLEKRPDEDEGPFSRDERRLIDALAERFGRIAERMRAETALREREERLALVLGAAALGIYDVDLQSGVAYCSSEYATMLGYDADELDIAPSSGTWEDLLHPDDRDRVLNDLDRHLRGEAEAYDVEFRLRTKAGDWQWIRSRGRVVERDAAGRALRLVGTHADIDLRKRAQEAMEESETRFRTLSENALTGVDIIQDGQLLYVNPAMANIFGYEPAELIGASPLKVIHPDDLALVTENLKQRVDGAVKSIHYEVRGLCKNGEERAIEVLGSAATLNGRPAIVGNILDITERKKAEHALRESDERYRGLIDNSPNVIFTMDLTGKLTFASHRAKELLGYESEELINKSVLDFIPEEERLAAMEGIQKGMTGVGIKRFETPMIKKSGETAWFECSFARLRRDGAVVGAQGTAVDITERKRAEDLLKRSEQDALRMAAQLRRVRDLNAHISEGLGLDRVMQAVYEQCTDLMPIDTFYIALYDESAGVATFPFYYKDGARREIPPRDVRTSPGLVSHVIAGRETVYLPDAPASSLHLVHQPGSLTRSIVAVPLSLHGQILGVFSAQSAEPNAYTEEQTATLEQLAGGIAVALENSRLYDSVSQGLEATLAALGRAAETRDPYTAGHQQRVTDLALAIASKLGLTADACHALRISGMLHDIGKLGIPAEILSKPSALSRIEFSLIQTHPKNAYDILAGISFPGPVVEIVLQHHERLDGSGYPNGIMGDDILPEARVLAVADVVEAMASHRPYRPALGITAALDEIRSGRGARYDERVVDACVALFESGEFTFDAA